MSEVNDDAVDTIVANTKAIKAGSMRVGPSFSFTFILLDSSSRSFLLIRGSSVQIHCLL